MSDAYSSGSSLGDLLVPLKAATIYQAQESSLFLSGALIPLVTTPGITLRVPKIVDVTAESLAAATNLTDFTAQNVTDSKVDITVDLIAARSVVRDLGGIAPNEIGRSLGQSVAKKFDLACIAALDSLEANDTVDIGSVDVDDILDVVGQIRGNGEMGQLYAVISPTAAVELMKIIGTAAYAGGDFQTEALRNGFLGKIAGVNMFMSAHVGVSSATKMGYVFGENAARIAMQNNVNVEIGRRPEAVGFDVVASIAAGVGVVDSTRGVRLVDVV
jgi:hypothetical protein